MWGNPFPELVMRNLVRLSGLVLVVAGCNSIGDPVAPTGGGPTSTPDVAPVVSGRVLSKEFGLMGGVQIDAQPGDRTTVTGPDGQWRIDGLQPGAVSIRLSGLPAGCRDPGAQAATVPQDGTVRIRVLVDCSGTGEVQPPA